MTRVLFICTANICRSPMAEGMLRHRAETGGRTDIIVSSMGVHGMEDQPASELSVAVCGEHGVDISAHRSRPLSGEELRDADLILCMEPAHVQFLTAFFPWHRDRVHLMGAWPGKANRKSAVKDPIGGSVDKYRRTWEIMEKHVDRILDHL